MPRSGRATSTCSCDSVGPTRARGARYFSLVRELERVSGLPVDLVEDEGLGQSLLRAEIDRDGVVILEAA